MAEVAAQGKDDCALTRLTLCGCTAILARVDTSSVLLVLLP